MRIKYIADDGTAFNTADECLRYECGLKIYDETFRETKEFTKGIYFRVLNEKAREQFIALDEAEIGEGRTAYPDLYGIWFYDMNRDMMTTVSEAAYWYKNLETVFQDAPKIGDYASNQMRL